MEKRARRIHDRLRMKAKAKRVGEINGVPGNWAKLYDHLAACSCYSCGNPRKYFKERTMQERRAPSLRQEASMTNPGGGGG